MFKAQPVITSAYALALLSLSGFSAVPSAFADEQSAALKGAQAQTTEVARVSHRRSKRTNQKISALPVTSGQTEASAIHSKGKKKAELTDTVDSTMLPYQ
jgi:uncharacterized membrane protein YqiK